MSESSRMIQTFKESNQSQSRPKSWQLPKAVLQTAQLFSTNWRLHVLDRGTTPMTEGCGLCVRMGLLEGESFWIVFRFSVFCVRRLSSWRQADVICLGCDVIVDGERVFICYRVTRAQIMPLQPRNAKRQVADERGDGDGDADRCLNPKETNGSQTVRPERKAKEAEKAHSAE